MRLTSTKRRRCCPRCSAPLACTAAARNRASCAPVTDAMLQNPDAADWLSWRRTLNHWGYSPLDADRRAQRRAAAPRLDAPARARRAGRHAARARRRDVLPEPERHHASHRRRDRRSDLGIPPARAGRQQRLHPVPVDQPQPRDLRQSDSRQRRRQLRVRARRAHRRARRGKRRSSTTAAARSTARGRSSRTAR